MICSLDIGIVLTEKFKREKCHINDLISFEPMVSNSINDFNLHFDLAKCDSLRILVNG